MIVTCERCATQFQLDDSRVPPEGVRVRCSRCKHAFHIELPLPEAERIRRAAAEARSDAPAAPDTTRELPVGAAVEPSIEESAPTDDVFDDEESDWEFNDDRSADVLRTGGDEPLDGGDGPAGDEALDGGDGPAGDEPLDGGDGPAGDEALDGGDGPAGDEALESAFSAGASFDLSGEEDEGEESIPLEGEEPPAPAAPAPPEDMPGGEARIEAEASVASPDADDPFSPKAESDAAPGEDLGSPAEWDFFSSDEEPGSNIANELTDAAELLGSVTPVHVVPPDLVEDEEVERSRWLAAASQGAGWLVVCALFGFGLIAGLTPAGDSTTAVAAQPLAGLQIEDVAGQWVENVVAGPVLVVRGSLRNAGSAPRSDGGHLRIELLDAQGRPIPAAGQGLGPEIDPRRIREVAPRALQAQQDREAQSGALAGIPPRTAMRFSAVLSGVPVEAAGFRVVVDEAWAKALPAPSEEAAPRAGDAPPLAEAALPESRRVVPNPDLDVEIEDLVGVAMDPAPELESAEAAAAVPAEAAP